MRHKELRIALVCYGGVSLAVYMHGVTKELWKLARASRLGPAGGDTLTASERVYADLFERIADDGLNLRVLPDILTGASAGGINAVFLAQAIHSGQSLEPLTDLWLEGADIDQLLDPDAKPWSRMAKFWAQPLVSYLFTRPGNAVSESVAPETRHEVRVKLSRLIRSRWFAPPFSGSTFSNLLAEALEAMVASPTTDPLLPANHPLDLFVTATDFHGARQTIRLHSPQLVEEREHRMAIGFTARTPMESGVPLTEPIELVLAARSTASFPGAFSPLMLDEMDGVVRGRNWTWHNREGFLRRVMPAHVAAGDTAQVALIDGSVLVNAPFAEAIAVLDKRPAQREVDRRFVYIDPRPRGFAAGDADTRQGPGFFRTILGSLSGIPRQQPIRDNLEALAAQSREAERLQAIIRSLRPEVEATVDRLFGRTLFLDRPTPKRLSAWREKAQQAAAEGVGYAYGSYAEHKYAGIIDDLAETLAKAGEGRDLPPLSAITAIIRGALQRDGLEGLTSAGAGASERAITFFRRHDLGFRIRRLRLLARRLARDWEADPDIPDEALDLARETIFAILARYFSADEGLADNADLGAALNDLATAPLTALDQLAQHRDLKAVDEAAEATLAEALEEMPRNLRRRVLLAYLGFPFYDIATLPLLKTDDLTEFEPVKVDRISPEDAASIREGGSTNTLRGTEFFNFGAFFSRAYRENDYLWGRLHGAERMIDLVISTLEDPPDTEVERAAKRAIFLAILDEEEPRLTADRNLVAGLRAEVIARLGDGLSA